jgi:hypothetical protein
VSAGVIAWLAVSRPLTVSTAPATLAGAVAVWSGARSALPSGPLKVPNVTPNAFAAAWTDP